MRGWAVPPWLDGAPRCSSGYNFETWGAHCELAQGPRGGSAERVVKFVLRFAKARDFELTHQSIADLTNLNRAAVLRIISDIARNDVGEVLSPASLRRCLMPGCLELPPSAAAEIDTETGLVLHDDEACIGCDTCVGACPYGEPVHIDELGIVKKCDACAVLRANGEDPSCVASCPMRAIEFGDIEELRAKHPEAVADFATIPSSQTTQPNVLYKIKECMLDDDFDVVPL